MDTVGHFTAFLAPNHKMPIVGSWVVATKNFIAKHP